MSDGWVHINGADVRHVWSSPDGAETSVSPAFYAQNGVPVCDSDSEHDGAEMTYVRAEVRQCPLCGRPPAPTAAAPPPLPAPAGSIVAVAAAAPYHVEAVAPDGRYRFAVANESVVLGLFMHRYAADRCAEAFNQPHRAREAALAARDERDKNSTPMRLPTKGDPRD